MKMKDGDYVLASKYDDGDPHDHWAVGLYVKEFKVGKQRRHDIVDGDGKLFRHNGFRRVQHITEQEGDWIIENKDEMHCQKSVWHFLREFRRQNR
jgi:hypothetical protein